MMHKNDSITENAEVAGDEWVNLTFPQYFANEKVADSTLLLYTQCKDIDYG